MAPRKQRLDPLKAVGYIRVSTEDQHLGPEAQRDALDGWCGAHRVVLVAVHVDQGVSGGAELERRPGLLDAIGALAALSAGVLLVAKRDRLARDVMLAAMLERLVERHGASVKSADNVGNEVGPEAQLLRHMVNAFAEYERALIRSRTRAALAVKKAKGERVGQVPYGFRLDEDGKHLVEDHHEHKVLRRIKRLRASGLSLRRIVDELNEKATPARGHRWHLQTVARLVGRQSRT